MSESLVSVCVPVYNHEMYVSDCIKSLLNQTYENIELIIINDGSTDRSDNIILPLLGECESRFVRFKYISRKNIGLCNTINEALEWCKGEYFSVLASDDQWLPEKILTQVNYLNSNGHSAGVFGGIHIIDEANDPIRTKSVKVAQQYCFEDVILSRTFLAAPSATLRTDLVKAVGGFDQKYKVEDWYMWLRLTESGDYTLDCLPDIVAKYRRHDFNVSKDYRFMLSEQYKILNLYSCSKYFADAEAVLLFSAFTALVPHEKFKAVSFIPGFLRLWREKKFWFALSKLLVPKSILKRRFN